MSVMLESHETLKFMMSQIDILQGHALHAALVATSCTDAMRELGHSKVVNLVMSWVSEDGILAMYSECSA